MRGRHFLRLVLCGPPVLLSKKFAGKAKAKLDAPLPDARARTFEFHAAHPGDDWQSDVLHSQMSVPIPLLSHVSPFQVPTLLCNSKNGARAAALFGSLDCA